MLQYFTSHGQVDCQTYWHDDPQLPLGQCALSELGREQAQLLGEHLKTLGFCGTILCSPFSHALETAELIADATGSVILPFAPLQERFPDTESVRHFHGMTIEEIRSRFSHIAPDAVLEYPWWPQICESPEDVMRRVALGYGQVVREYPDQELLFLGHGATCDAFISILELQPAPNSRQYNCALTTVEPISWRYVPEVRSTAFLPYQKTTLNCQSKENCDLAYFAAPHNAQIPLPDLSAYTGELVLHIGDTESWEYPCLRHLFELVRPDVILHTGDMADEVKIGRHPEYRYEYVRKISVLLDMMKQTGARLVIVPGNHDLAEEIIRLAPEAEVYPAGSEVILSGVPCRVGHEVRKMVFDRKYCLYGHGMAGEKWRYSMNIPGGHCRFNVAFGTFFYDLANDRFSRIGRPIPTIPNP